MKLIINTDGGSRGNPGPGAIGVVIRDESGKIIKTHKECVGKVTNNQAEYLALVSGLNLAKAQGGTEVACRLDSELLVKQMRREYKVKDPNIGPLFIKANNAAILFKSVSFTHIRRELDHEADALVNEALDGDC